jgi:hypothetical protein
MQAMTFSIRVRMPDQVKFSDRDVARVVDTMKRDVTRGLLRRKLLEDELTGRTAVLLADLARELHSKPS